MINTWHWTGQNTDLLFCRTCSWVRRFLQIRIFSSPSEPEQNIDISLFRTCSRVLGLLEIRIFSSPSEHEQKIDMLLFRTYSFIIIIYCPGNIKGLRHKVAWDIRSRKFELWEEKSLSSFINYKIKTWIQG